MWGAGWGARARGALAVGVCARGGEEVHGDVFMRESDCVCVGRTRAWKALREDAWRHAARVAEWLRAYGGTRAGGARNEPGTNP